MLKTYSSLCFIVFIVNFHFIHSQSHVLAPSAVCPPNFELKNGLCYPSPNLSICPPDYFLYTDGLCYPIERKPCPADEINKSTTSTTTTTTATTPVPSEIRQITCPRGSIMYKNKCRKIICTSGEYYRGNCNRPICPPGLVWRGKQCQRPGFITTVIEIDNTFVNEINNKEYALETSDQNEIINHTTNFLPTTTTSKPERIKDTIEPVSRKPQITATTNKSLSNGTCCQVISPRICKKYAKWQCFSRRFTICDDRVCTAPLLYLKAPEIKYDHPMLVMPPNPQLDTCKNSSCNTNADIVDCSGCANRITENCSSYCYSYVCPKEACNFLNLENYCSYYSGQSGCKPSDGCLWSWCTKSI